MTNINWWKGKKKTTALKINNSFWVIQDVPSNLPLKSGRNRVSNCWDIADIEFLWWWVGDSEKSFLRKT